MILMDTYIGNIDDDTTSNDNFRKVLFTGKNSQLVVMSLKPGEDIGSEIHPTVDQFLRIEKGQGKAILDDVEHDIKENFAVVVPAGTKHNLVNTSETEDLKLYTIYSPPEHKTGTIHQTKKDAMGDEDDHY